MAIRVAFFTDCFHEVNGVGLTSRQFAGFAKSSGRPFLAVHRGPETKHIPSRDYETLELADSNLRLGLERDLAFDLGFLRHRKLVKTITAAFQPDLIHVTSPGHIGLLGAITAQSLGVPLVASWHTNIHEFGARRLDQKIRWLPDSARKQTVQWAEDRSLDCVLRFYRRAKLLFAPNPELVSMLQQRTGSPCYLMERGIDIETFSPIRRTRETGDFVIGFVGRLSVEKNIRLLADLDQRLRAQDLDRYRFLIVGDGGEREWLRSHIPNADLPGILRGKALAEAYANMDVFVFPSETDTYGNVIQEALASGVPCVVSAHGGPKYLVRERETGFVSTSPQAYADAVATLLKDSSLRRQMRSNARHAAEGRTWAAVFEGIYARYGDHLSPDGAPAPPQTNQADIVSPNLHQNCNLR